MRKLLYPTWYEFKKDLQIETGHKILNEEWLQLKPKDPLPWNFLHFWQTLTQMHQGHEEQKYLPLKRRGWSYEHRTKNKN